MRPSPTHWPGCVPPRSRAGVRCTTWPRTSLNGGCGSMTETGAGGPPRPADSGPGGRGEDNGRADARARAFARLADTLASDFDVVDFLHGLSADSVEILRAAAAGVMLADGRGGMGPIGSPDEPMRLLEVVVV